jgi:hypothetical protein
MGKTPCRRFKHLKHTTRGSPAKRKIRRTKSLFLDDGRRAEINRLLLHENVAGIMTNKKRKLSHKMW